MDSSREFEQRENHVVDQMQDIIVGILWELKPGFPLLHQNKYKGLFKDQNKKFRDYPNNMIQKEIPYFLYIKDFLRAKIIFVRAVRIMMQMESPCLLPSLRTFKGPSELYDANGKSLFLFPSSRKPRWT